MESIVGKRHCSVIPGSINHDGDELLGPMEPPRSLQGPREHRLTVGQDVALNLVRPEN